MQNGGKKGIIILGVIIVIAVIIVLIVNGNKKKENTSNEVKNNSSEEFVKVLEDGTKLNTSTKLSETKTFDGMEISNFQLTSQSGVTQLLGTIKNTSTTAKGGYPIKITILDKNGNTITTVTGYIKELQAGESTELNASKTFDYANAYDFVISKK